MTYRKDDPVLVIEEKNGWYIEDFRKTKFNRNQSFTPLEEEDFDKISLYCHYVNGNAAVFPNLLTLFPEPINPRDWLNDLTFYRRKLSGKPQLKRLPVPVYRNRYTGEKFSIKIIPRSYGYVCEECGKWKARDEEHWNEIIKEIPSFTEESDRFIDSNGCLVCITKQDIEGGVLSEPEVIVWTNKEFVHRAYCSDECYRKSRERKRKDRREEERIKRYRKIPVEQRPDNRCKICGKDISYKRAGSLTCSDAHRQQFKRLKKKGS